MSDRVSISEICIERSPTKLKAYGIGSCIVVGIHDPATGLGALGHLLLPQRPVENPAGSECKYVDAGICMMVDSLIKEGANRDTLVAKLTGGANMFESAYHTLISSIGARNAKSAKRTLAVLGIPLVAEDVGGNRGRTVEFDLATGDMMVYCARSEEETIL